MGQQVGAGECRHTSPDSETKKLEWIPGDGRRTLWVQKGPDGVLGTSSGLPSDHPGSPRWEG